MTKWVKELPKPNIKFAILVRIFCHRCNTVGNKEELIPLYKTAEDSRELIQSREYVCPICKAKVTATYDFTEAQT